MQLLKKTAMLFFIYLTVTFHFAKGNSGRDDYFQRAYSRSEKMILPINWSRDIFG
jgi:hypothetical protein